MLEMESLTIHTVSRCNRFFATETRHPLVSVIRLSEGADIPESVRFGFYTLWLKEWTGGICPSCFGQKACDFNDGTLIPLQPGRPAVPELSKDSNGTGRLLCFQASVFDPLTLRKGSDNYSFFRYRPEESLHLSRREREILEREMDGIEMELNWGVDECSRTILAQRIRLTLDYALRFYRQQFILRHAENQELVNRTDLELEAFFRSGRARSVQIPAAKEFAGLFGCSEAYFNDLLKQETGKRTPDYVQCKRIAFARELLRQGRSSVEEVAAQLGFRGDPAFCALFRRLAEMPPQGSFRQSDAHPLN